MRVKFGGLILILSLLGFAITAPAKAADQISGDCTNPSPSVYNDVTFDLSQYTLPLTATFTNCYFFYLYQNNTQISASEGNITTTPNADYNPTTPTPGQAYVADSTQIFTINGPGVINIYLPWYGVNGSGFYYRFIYPSPTISSFSPWYSNVAGGTSVTISGANFAPGATVSFGSVPASDVTVVNSTTITATTNAYIAAANNYVNVKVTNPTGNSAEVGGFFYSDSPAVTAISPSSGPTSGGTTITVTGSNLYLVDPLTSVRLNGVSVPVNTYSSNFFSITTPVGVAGIIDLSVSTLGGLVTVPNAFTFFDEPIITSISPTSGTTAGGTAVTITGSNLADASSVTFGGTAGVISSNSSSQIVVTTPAKSAGPVAVVVTTPGGSVTSGTNFTYVSPTTSSNNRQSTTGSCSSASSSANSKSSGRGSSKNANAFCSSTSGPSK